MARNTFLPETPCNECGQVHDRCIGHKKRSDPKTPCLVWPEKGAVSCQKVHGGKAPQVRAGAEERRLEQAARTALKTFGIVDDPSDLPPVQVYAELQLAAARSRFTVEWLESQVSTLHGGDLSYETKLGDRKVDPYVVMLQEERKKYTDLLVQMARLGIEERVADAQVALAQGVVAALQTVFTALVAGLALSPEQQTVARTIVQRELLALEA